MSASKKHPCMLIDLAGTGLLVAWLFAILSMTVLRDDAIASEIRNLKDSIAQSSQGLAAMQAQLDQSRNQLHTNRDILTKRGKLPETAPVEEYFQFLSEIADQHNLSILNHYPTGERNYPGLRERRFAYTISGSLPRIVGFFQEVESSSYWADVGYLMIRPPRATKPADAGTREAQLTICLFSAEAAACDEG